MAKTCKKCGLDYLREVEYCGHCGALLSEKRKETIYCPICKARSLHNASYCVDCGKALPQKNEDK